jgi:choline dehydrogenase-like flavoprotein
MAQDTGPADVAIVGSGPVGLSLGLALADAGLDVVLIESGLDRADADRQALADAEKIAGDRHAPMALATRRAFGGTSHVWGGRCVPFDAQDFAARAHLAEARWPIGIDDIAPFIAPACAFLGCGRPVFAAPWPRAHQNAGGLRLDRLERWCSDPNMRRVHGARALAHPKLQVKLGTTALKLAVDPVDGRAVRLDIERAGERQALAARAFVVAGGGLETARLLLASRAEAPNLFGGADGALGRFYMGHLFGTIADIVFATPRDDRAFDFMRDVDGTYIRRRITLDAATQSAHGLLNLVAWPEPPALYDHRHGSGVLSLAYLALATPGLGSRLMVEAIRRRKLGDGPPAIAAHLANVMRDIFGSAAFALSFLKRRYLDAVRLPGFFVPNAAGRHAFHFHAEQRPDAASRVRLGDTRDVLGQPRLVVEHRFNRGDAASVVASHELIAARLAECGLARLDFTIAPEARVDAVLAQVGDGFHQIGTARMAADPREGVVDGHCRVHGSTNLFVVGSAVFPTSSQANPTLLAVALSARLGAHLRSSFLDLPAKPIVLG